MANLLHSSNVLLRREDSLNSGYQIEDFQPTGLYRIREDDEVDNEPEDESSKHCNLLSKFSNESLYSFSFSSSSGDYKKLSSRLDIYNRNSSYYNGLLSASLRSDSSKKYSSPLANFVLTAGQETEKPRFNLFKKRPEEKKLDFNVPKPIGNLDQNSISQNNVTINIIKEEPSDENDQKTSPSSDASSNIATSHKKSIGGPKVNLNINTQNLNVNGNKGFIATPTVCSTRSPLRILSQATITTDGNLRIMTVNDIFCGLIKNNSKDKIVGKSIIEILFGLNEETFNVKESDSNNDKNENYFMESVKTFTEKHLRHQKSNIIDVIQKDKNEAMEHGIVLMSSQNEKPDSPFFFSNTNNTSGEAQNDPDTEKFLKDKVLICGQVVRIKSYDKNDSYGLTKAVSIWLKRKTYKNGTGYSFFYIWILEEVKDKVVDVEIDNLGNILNSSTSCKEVFGYSSEDIKNMNLKIQNLIPGIEGSYNFINSIIKMKNFTGKTNEGTYFPVSTSIYEMRSKGKNEEDLKKNVKSLPNVQGSISSSLNSISNLSEKCNQYHVSITAIPNISGIIVVDEDGLIKAYNNTFVHHLLGFQSSELINKSIVDVMPHFWGIVNNMHEDDQRHLDNGRILSASFCKKRANDFPIASALPENSHRSGFKDYDLNTYISNRYNSIKSAGIVIKTLESSLNELQVKTNGVVIYHKDGSAINVNVKMRKFMQKSSKDSPNSNNEDAPSVFAIWIMYSRNYAELSTPKSTKSAENEKQQNGYNKFREIDIQERIDHFIKKMDEMNTPSPVSGGLVGDIQEKLSVEEKEAKPAVQEYQWTKPTSIDEFEILDSLGDGAYGIVKLAYRKDDPKHEKLVIKYIIKSKILPDFWMQDEDIGKVPKEISILNEIKKKSKGQEVYIVNMVDYFEDKENFYLISKQHGFMDLFDYVEFDKEMSESKIKKIFYQVCKSIQFLHHNGIVHRDIKDENIVIDEDCNIELIDFGSSTHYDRKNPFDTFCGTIDYASPEVLTGHSYVGPPQDVWALGILLYILIYKENPFYNVDEIISAKLRVPFILSDNSIDLVKKLLTKNERIRVDIDKVLEHPWFSDINGNDS